MTRRPTALSQVMGGTGGDDMLQAGLLNAVWAWLKTKDMTEGAGMWASATTLHSHIWREQFGGLASRFQRAECHLRRRTPKGTNEACAPWRPANMLLEHKLTSPGRGLTMKISKPSSQGTTRALIRNDTFHTAHPLVFFSYNRKEERRFISLIK